MTSINQRKTLAGSAILAVVMFTSCRERSEGFNRLTIVPSSEFVCTTENSDGEYNLVVKESEVGPDSGLTFRVLHGKTLQTVVEAKYVPAGAMALESAVIVRRHGAMGLSRLVMLLGGGKDQAFKKQAVLVWLRLVDSQVELIKQIPRSEDNYYASISAIADQDGDGIDEIVLARYSAPALKSGKSTVGVEVLSGSNGGIIAELNLPRADNPQHVSVCGWRDLDNDDSEDYAIGISSFNESTHESVGSGAVHVLSSRTNTVLKTVFPSDGQHIGRCLNACHDWDGDGRKDLLFGDSNRWTLMFDLEVVYEGPWLSALDFVGLGRFSHDRGVGVAVVAWENRSSVFPWRDGMEFTLALWECLPFKDFNPQQRPVLSAPSLIGRNIVLPDMNGDGLSDLWCLGSVVITK